MSHWDTDDFQTDVIERSHEIPVLVDFWAEWCGPCRVLGPVLERMAANSGQDWALAKLDTEAHPEVAARFGIRSIPAVKLFVDGEVADEFVGALPEQQIREFLSRALPSPAAAELDRARQLLASDAAGDRTLGCNVLESLIAARPDDAEPRLMLARARLLEQPTAAADAISTIGQGTRHGEEADALRLLAGLVVLADDQIAEGRGKGPFVRALAALRAGDAVAALDGLIEVIERDRGYGDEIARRASLALFAYLGESHPAARDRRMAFTNAVCA